MPKDRFEAVTGSLDALGNVISLRADAQNITAQFFDTESRLASYRIQEERLLSMLEKADPYDGLCILTTNSFFCDCLVFYHHSLVISVIMWHNDVDYEAVKEIRRESI